MFKIICNIYRIGVSFLLREKVDNLFMQAIPLSHICKPQIEMVPRQLQGTAVIPTSILQIRITDCFIPDNQ